MWRSNLSDCAASITWQDELIPPMSVLGKVTPGLAAPVCDAVRADMDVPVSKEALALWEEQERSSAEILPPSI